MNFQYGIKLKMRSFVTGKWLSSRQGLIKYLVCFFSSLVVFFSNSFATDHNSMLKPQLSVKEINSENTDAALIVGNFEQITSEQGKEVVIPLKLNKAPIGDIIVFCRSKNPNEGKEITERVVFEIQEWQKSKQCRIKGQDDFVADGNQKYLVEITIKSQKDLEYNRLPAIYREIVNLDDDKPSIVAPKIHGITSENGDAAPISFHLSSRPTADVRIPIKTDNPNEGIPKQTEILITTENWKKRHQVLVIGQDDSMADGSVVYRISGGPAVSDDPLYNGLVSEFVTLTNKDNDQASFLISPSAKFTSEDGKEATLSVRLQSKPLKPVILTFNSSKLTEGDCQPRQIKFDPSNWKVPQKVRVFGLNDLISDGDQTYEIHVSPINSIDKLYRTLDSKTLSFLNKDDDQAKIVVFKNQVETSESGGLAKLKIKLTSKPTAEVTLNIRTSDPTEGRPLLNRITFNENDWFLEKTIAVIGVDDNNVDGDQPYSLMIGKAETEDKNYSKIIVENIEMVNRDNELAGFQYKIDNTNLSESGTVANLLLKLSAKPADSVFVRVNSTDPTEAETAPNEILFLPEKWNTFQKVEVKSVKDDIVDGDKKFKILVKGETKDKNFSSEPLKIEFSNQDINTYNFIYELNDAITSEDQKSTELKIKLNSNPGKELKLRLLSADPGEGKAEPDMLVFNQHNWQIFQSVLVKGQDDDIQDGDVPYTLKVFAENEEESGFGRQPPLEIQLINKDNDQAGIEVEMVSDEVFEKEGYATFSIVLKSEPTSSVVFIFATSDDSEAAMADHHAAFFSHNWNKKQLIRVKGVSDYIVDGSQKFQVTSLGAISKDLYYNKMAFPSLTMMCHDQDQPGFFVGGVQGQASEDGGKAFFNLKLTTIPEEPVKINLTSSDENEGEVSPKSLVFDRMNWQQGHDVTVTGLDDGKKDGDTEFFIQFTESESEDLAYKGLSHEPLQLTNLDNKDKAFGLIFSQFAFQESIKDKVDGSTAMGLSYETVYSQYLDLNMKFYNVSANGSSTVRKYQVDNPMAYKLDYTGLAFGSNFALWRKFIKTQLKGGIELAYWNLESENQFSGYKSSNDGISMGVYAGLGGDINLWRSMIISMDYSYHYISRGLANSQIVLGLKYSI